MREWLNSPPVFMELGRRSLKARREGAGLEVPLERGADGKITAVSRDLAVARLQAFLGRKRWQPAVRAVCGLGVQGVSLRRMTVPTAAKGELEGVLRLQIEAEFPLSPDSLAWGWRELADDAAKCEVLVAAVRREVVEEYAALLAAAGMNPEFTLSALARNALTPSPDAAQLLLEAGAEGLELVSFSGGLPLAVRVLPLTGPVEKTVTDLAAGTVYLSGPAAETISARLAGRADCRRLAVPDGEGNSAATAGLEKIVAAGLPFLRLQTRTEPARLAVKFSFQEHRPALLRVAGLLALLLLLPYGEALLFRPLVARKIAAFQAEQARFTAVVDPELNFLQSLKQTQPPYLDALYVLAQSAPPGLHLDSLSLNQRGEISLKASLQNGQQVTDFRTKLIASGFFGAPTVEEQTPTPDRQKVNFRMSAEWKPAGFRPVLKVEMPAAGTNQPNPNLP